VHDIAVVASDYHTELQGLLSFEVFICIASLKLSDLLWTKIKKK
jgi:hypothetical protein